MTKPDDIDQDAWNAGARMAGEYLSWLRAGNSAGHLSEHAVAAMADIIARAIMSARAEERERWKPATVYFERYCQDEADDVENCVCGLRQHEDAKAFAAAIRNRP